MDSPLGRQDIVVMGLETWAGKGGRMGEEEKEWHMLNISFIPGFVVERPVEKT